MSDTRETAEQRDTPPPGWHASLSQNMHKPWSCERVSACTGTYATEQEAIDAAWEAEARHKPAPTPPRYDEVYMDGTAALDADPGVTGDYLGTFTIGSEPAPTVTPSTFPTGAMERMSRRGHTGEGSSTQGASEDDEPHSPPGDTRETARKKTTMTPAEEELRAIRFALLTFTPDGDPDVSTLWLAEQAARDYDELVRANDKIRQLEAER